MLYNGVDHYQPYCLHVQGGRVSQAMAEDSRGVDFYVQDLSAVCW